MLARNFILGGMVALALFIYMTNMGAPTWAVLMVTGFTGAIAGFGTAYEQREAARVARLARLKGEATDGKA